MHILVVNDDGPPCRKLSPYVRPLVEALQDAGHQVSVAVPAMSRSWIGKAHIIGASLTATYVHPDLFRDDGTWESSTVEVESTNGYDGPASSSSSSSASSLLPPTPTSSNEHLRPPATQHLEWVVVSNGTPASCAQLGIYELFQDRGDIDLVISGPNHGRNASTIYNLSSGTVGGALEAATCGKKGIALSFGSKEEQEIRVIQAAARLSVRLVEHLYRNWDDRVDLYNLNVPMRPDVESRPIRYTRALPNVWTKGSLYAEVDQPQNSSADKTTTIPTTPSVNGSVNDNASKTTIATQWEPGSTCRQRHFQWSTELSDIKKSLQESGEGTDARTVLDGFTSVTPLLANFWHPPGFKGELKLGDN